MPYIALEKRIVLAPHIGALIDALRQLQSDDLPVDNSEDYLSYVFLAILSQLYNRDVGDVKDALGLLSEVSQEYYRRVAVPLQEQRRFDNDDIFSVPAPFPTES